MKNIGLLLTCNEADIIEEVMKSHASFFDTILVLDGSTDGTDEIIRSFDCVKAFINQHDLSIRAPIRDSIRQILLETAQQKYGFGGWFTLLHGDEIFVDDPTIIASRAEACKAEKVNWHTLNFFPHISQKDEFLNSNEHPMTHLRFYQPGGLEIRQFKNKPGTYYPLNQHRNVLPKGISWRILRDFPILKHYVLRSNIHKQQKHASDRMVQYHHDFQSDDYFEPYLDPNRQVREFTINFEEFHPNNRPPFWAQALRWPLYNWAWWSKKHSISI